jgi:RND family efflux transporter MFP subunit
MNDNSPSRWRIAWIMPPLIIGIGVLMWAKSGKQPPLRVERGEPVHAVRVIAAAQVDLVPSAEGYGVVQPAQIWRAVAQVEGRIVEMHPQLRDGEILPQGTPLFRIDPVDYELKLAQAKAELAELDVQAANARSSLEIEQRNLSLALREQERYQQLAKQGTASQSQLDNAERTRLNTRAAVQNLQNNLALIPTQKRLLEAKLAQAERDLDNTRVQAPFNLRVAGLQMEAEQYVTKGQKLFEGDAVDRVEIVARVAMSTLRRLFIGRQLTLSEATDLTRDLPNLIGFRPLVRLDLGNHVAQWEAEFVRFSDWVDPDTRTMGVVVAVDNPFSKIQPGYRPPLSKGMFVQVILRGHAQAEQLVVPRAAVRDGAVYIADADNRLQRRQVKVLFDLGSISVIADGIDPNDKVVVSDLVPAVDGMLLRPELDQELNQAMLDAVGGDS